MGRDKSHLRPTDWRGAISLEQYVVKLIKLKQTQSTEFQCLLRMYGRDKLVSIYKKHFKSNIVC